MPLCLGTWFWVSCRALAWIRVETCAFRSGGRAPGVWYVVIRYHSDWRLAGEMQSRNRGCAWEVPIATYIHTYMLYSAGAIDACSFKTEYFHLFGCGRYMFAITFFSFLFFFSSGSAAYLLGNRCCSSSCRALYWRRRRLIPSFFFLRLYLPRPPQCPDTEIAKPMTYCL